MHSIVAIIWLCFPEAIRIETSLSETGLGKISRGMKKSSWTRFVLFYKEQTFIFWELQKAFLCKIEVPQEARDQNTFLRMLFDLNGFDAHRNGVHD